LNDLKLESLYKRYDVADIDFYSPTPVKDLEDLTMYLHKKGYSYLYSKNALHEGTYVINYYHHTIINISYVPTIIYSSIPFKTLTVE
tara:strand:- start:1667 stop:1927 length:261 start_codon:yes stop_codon:yes gene_type:complete